ncbi:MAG: hypothetical protein QF524_06450, partial [Planctomycetota bacterium]|nr:hypothetical protein [Planctomycetota bacterium]
MANSWHLPRGSSGKNWRDRILSPLCESAIRQILPCPTAPYSEMLPAAAVRAYCKERGWRVKEDSAGNLLVRVPGKKGGRPSIAFEAHLDHPAMVVTSVKKDGRLGASFYG